MNSAGDHDAPAVVTDKKPEPVQGKWFDDGGYTTVYRPNTWYISGKGVEFIFFEPPRRDAGKKGYWVGKVMLADGTITILEWGPLTRERLGLARTVLQKVAPEVDGLLQRAKARWARQRIR